jgi:hypothetical protein
MRRQSGWIAEARRATPVRVTRPCALATDADRLGLPRVKQLRADAF